MDAPVNSLAILNAAGRVVTFVRSDVPAGWQPPVGHTAVPAAELPANWEHASAPDAMPPTIPASVTRRQLKQWLVLAGKYSAVEAALAAIPDETDRQLAQIWWVDATEFERTHPLVSQIGAVVGMTDAEIDAAFTEAATL